jgi:exodeoxyribonuclease V alpha subunit
MQISNKAPLECVKGTVERVTFHNEENGFCVLRLLVKGRNDVVTLIGHVPNISPGEFIEASGVWFNDKKHGLQFKAEYLAALPPTTLVGIEKYLASGMVKGIGVHFAKKLVDAFGDQVFDVIEQEPERMLKLEGMGEKRKNLVVASWTEQKSIRNIMVFLQSHGVGTNRAVRIYKTYGDDAIETVRTNPYRLALDIRGIGFKTADELAQKLGIPADSLIRAQAGVRHVLLELCNHGHCAAVYETLVEASIALLDIPQSTISAAIAKELQEKNLVAEKIDEADYIFPAYLHRAESGAAALLVDLQSGAPPWGSIDSKQAIAWAEQKTQFYLSASQKTAITQILRHKVGIITGGPGVGKTTIMKTLILTLRAKKMGIALCAPTGRAAKRLSEVSGLGAKTIHRLLEFDPTTRNFKHDQNNPLPIDVLIVDEASMLDIVLFYQLLKAVPPSAALVLVGDVDQLPSVSSGAVLSDLIRSGKVETVQLTEIFRQAADSHIIINAHRINQGNMPVSAGQAISDFYVVYRETSEEIHDTLIELVAERIPKRFNYDPRQDIQVLTPMNRGGLGSITLNIALQQRLNGESIPKVNRFGWSFSPGDKVIQTINNYDKEVFNGDIGVIGDINLEEGLVRVHYEGRPVDYDMNELDELSLAYAITIHKSQGSEFPVVVIPLATQHYALLAKNLLYTGVTRGKSLVVLIGQKKAVAMAIHNNRAAQRITKLAQRL